MSHTLIQAKQMIQDLAKKMLEVDTELAMSFNTVVLTLSHIENVDQKIEILKGLKDKFNTSEKEALLNDHIIPYISAGFSPQLLVEAIVDQAFNF